MTERTLTGIGMPAIEACPECGSDRLIGTSIAVNTSVFDLDGSGGIATWHDDVLHDTLIMSLECSKCDTVLVEGAEAVHPEVDA